MNSAQTLTIRIPAMPNLNSFSMGINRFHRDFSCFSLHPPVLIICSSLNSPTTKRIINQYKHYRYTKILLIDIIGNVFNYENRLYKSWNASEHNDLLVLTILTQKFKYILNHKFHSEFSRYLNLKSTHAKYPDNESGSESFCDLEKHNSSHYGSIANNFTSCQREIKERCRNYSNADIKSFCANIGSIGMNINGSNGSTSLSRKENDGYKKRLNDFSFNKQLVFSEFFNLFDFITSLLSGDEKNASNQDQNHQFDFIVLDFKSILNATSGNAAFWRPLMILEQNKRDRNVFTMHRALSDLDVFDEWMFQTSFFRCGTLCWSIIAAIVLILLSLIGIISMSAGIAAR